jgi:hypothetical protein
MYNFNVGDYVNYWANDSENKLQPASGNVTAIFLNPDNRLLVQVRSGEGKAVNVDYCLINASEDEAKAYRAAVAEADAIGMDGNAEVKALVDNYNERVQRHYDETIGPRIELKTAPDA